VDASIRRSGGKRKEAAMPFNVFEFNEHWDIPNGAVGDVYAVLAQGDLLPPWWKGVYLEAVPLNAGEQPKVGARLRAKARGALSYESNFILEAVEPVQDKKVVMRTIGDFIGLWTAVLHQQASGVRVDLNWKVTVERPILKYLSPLLRPALAWNHRWTTPRGEPGLREFLANRHSKGT
jgi:hypothetical protein